jgi:hypothetical protein
VNLPVILSGISIRGIEVPTIVKVFEHERTRDVVVNLLFASHPHLSDFRFAYIAQQTSAT